MCVMQCSTRARLLVCDALLAAIQPLPESQRPNIQKGRRLPT
ncbi:hypothetical protein O9992_24665 [Vibrio lentus]|nr:hypothetical protein [Vibrio lentus]